MFIKNILIKLCFAKYFNKFNIIVAFNKIRIRENDEKKTTFLIKYNFFEYVIILFEFYNISRIFQSFINVTLHKYLNDFCTNYINNILIYSNIRKKHVTHVFKIFRKLQKTNLFLDINKYEFFVDEIKYLNLIISIENVKINLFKIANVIN